MLFVAVMPYCAPEPESVAPKTQLLPVFSISARSRPVTAALKVIVKVVAPVVVALALFAYQSLVRLTTVGPAVWISRVLSAAETELVVVPLV